MTLDSQWVARLVPYLVLAMVASVCWWVLDRDIRHVEVDGVLSEAEQQEVRALVSGSLDGGVLSADIEALAQNLGALSWSRAVAVRRAWPDTLVVTVKKAAVIARWSDNAYLTSTGEVVNLAEPRNGLPALNCAHAEPLVAMEMHRSLAASVQPLRLAISQLEQNRLGEWIVRFDNGMSLILGATDVTARMNRFVYAYARSLRSHEGAIAQVDARYTNGLAVQFSEWIAGSTVDVVR